MCTLIESHTLSWHSHTHTDTWMYLPTVALPIHWLAYVLLDNRLPLAHSHLLTHHYRYLGSRWFGVHALSVRWDHGGQRLHHARCETSLKHFEKCYEMKNDEWKEMHQFDLFPLYHLNSTPPPLFLIFHIHFSLPLLFPSLPNNNHTLIHPICNSLVSLQAILRWMHVRTFLFSDSGGVINRREWEPSQVRSWILHSRLLMWYLDREVDIDIDIIVMYRVYRTKMLNFNVFVRSHISSNFNFKLLCTKRIQVFRQCDVIRWEGRKE